MTNLNLVSSENQPRLPGCAIIPPTDALSNEAVIRKPCHSVTNIALRVRTTGKSRIGLTTLAALKDYLSPAALEAGEGYKACVDAREPTSDMPLSAPFGGTQLCSDGRKTDTPDQHDHPVDEWNEPDFEPEDSDELSDEPLSVTGSDYEALNDDDAEDVQRGEQLLTTLTDAVAADTSDRPIKRSRVKQLAETIAAFDPSASENRFLSRVFKDDIRKHERAALKAALTGAPKWLNASIFNLLVVNNWRPFAVAQALVISPKSIRKHLCRAIERMAEYQARPPVARASAPDFVTPPSILRYAFTVCASLTTADAAPAMANRRQIAENFTDELPDEPRTIDAVKLAAVTAKTDALKKLKPSERPSADKLAALATEWLRANGFTAAESDLYQQRS